MRTRCLNPNNKRWKDYGGRGVTIDPRWDDFATFLEDMGERPKGKTLDRKNVDNSYCLDNCEWATPHQQARNQRTNRLITVGGKTMCLSEWAEHYGVKSDVLWKRIKRHGSMEGRGGLPIGKEKQRRAA